LEDKLLGKRLVDLPAPHTEVLMIELSDPERILYEAILERQGELCKESFDDGDPRKELANPLSQITRLRQSVTILHVLVWLSDENRLTASPELIEEEILVRYFKQIFGQFLTSSSSCSRWNTFKPFKGI
jgi:hypothetical protein